MSQTRTQLIAQIGSLLPDNSAQEITAADVRNVLTAIVNADLNLSDDAELLGFMLYDSSRTYRQNELTLESGQLYRSLTNNNTGHATSDTLHWQPVALGGGGAPPPGIELWDNATAYSTGDYVEYNGQIYRALVGNTGNPPANSPSEWEGVSLPGTFGSPWGSSTYYTAGDVVLFGDRLWRAVGSHLSGNFSTDQNAGLWVEVSPASGGYQGTRYHILAGEEQYIAPRHEYVVHSDFINDGTLVNEGHFINL